MNFSELLGFAPNAETQTIFAKGQTHINRCFGNIACAISGGSDSDIMLDIVSKLDENKKYNMCFLTRGLNMKQRNDILTNLKRNMG